MRGLQGLETLVVQRKFKSSSQNYACFWLTNFRGGVCPYRDPPWENVFEYLGESPWPMISVEGRQGDLQNLDVEWHKFGVLSGYCCRPDPIGTLNRLRIITGLPEATTVFLCLDELPYRYLMFSTRKWATAGALIDPKTKESYSLEYHNLCEKIIWYTIPRLKPGQPKPPNCYKAGSGNRMELLKRQYIGEFGDIDCEAVREWLKRQYRMK
jgi:hypothetical protein